MTTPTGFVPEAVTENNNLAVLEALLAALPAAVERRTLGDQLQHTIDQLHDAPQMVNRLAALFDLAQEIEFSADASQAESLEDLKAATRYAGDQLVRAKSGNDLKNAEDDYQALRKQVSSVDRQIRAHWARVVRRDFAPLGTIGGLLSNINPSSDLGKRLTECSYAAHQLSDKMPIVEFRDNVLKLKVTKDDLDQKRAALTGESEVDQFLDALARKSATLELLTDKVRDWLEKNGALPKFSIVPRQ
jgi:hypothetical protein